MYSIMAIFLFYLKVTTVSGQLRITNGQNAKRGQFPYQAFLIDPKRNYCGGSIVHERWILTAAHCNFQRISEVIVYVGTIESLGRGGVAHRAEAFVPHENFHDTNYDVVNDIALVRLKSNIKFNDKTKPVKLPVSDLKSDENQLAIVSGWGITDVSLRIRLNYPKVLQYVYVKVVDQCDKGWKNYNSRKICTSISGGKSACIGDSGGPVVINDTQVGIVSYGDGICGYNLPNVHTRVFSYMPWIKDKLKLYSDELQ